MSGSITFRPARNAYMIRWRERPGEPQRTRWSPGPETPQRQAVAEALRDELVAAASIGRRTPGRRLTVGRWLDEWLELQSGLRPSTRRAYAARIELYLRPLLGHHRLADLEPIDVQRAMARLATRKGERVAVIGPGTLEAAYKVLSAALNDAWAQGKAPMNAARFASVARSLPEIEPPTIDELDRIMAELAGEPWRPLLSVARWTGAREGELIGLEWHNLDLGAGTITLVKQARGPLKTKSSRRTLVLPPAVVAELETVPRRLGTELVFTSSTGRAVDQRNLLRVFQSACDRAAAAPRPEADMPRYRVHDLRHAFATMVLEAGGSTSSVQAWLGHGSLRMLDRYAHVRPVPGGDAQARVLEAWGRDALLLFGIAVLERRRAAR